MENNSAKDIKLVKCPQCRKAFYIRTTTKGKYKLQCPFCQKDVYVKINGDVQIKSKDDWGES